MKTLVAKQLKLNAGEFVRYKFLCQNNENIGGKATQIRCRGVCKVKVLS